MTALRPYQLRAIAEARAAVAGGARAPCIVAPCGAGKTLIGCEIARSAVERGRGVLWLAHRQELVEQARARLTVPATVATVQGLLASGSRPAADVVVLDEAHHHVADQWGTVAQHYASATLVGLTATPERGDGRPLGDLFDALVVAATYLELLAGGWIVPADVWAPPRRLRGIAEPLDAWTEHARGLSTVLYAGGLDHADELAARWQAAGWRAASVDGRTPDDLRRERLRALADGELDLLTNVHVLTEGWDCPSVRCVVLARGFSSPGSYLQAVGRALRPAPGKTHALVLDLGGAVRDHGLPDDDRAYSLTGRAIARAAGDREPLRQCQWCGAVFRAPGRTCPRCGRSVARPRTVEERRAALERVREASTHDTRAHHWVRLRAEARQRGYKPGWAAYRYRSIYGEWPPRERREHLL